MEKTPEKIQRLLRQVIDQFEQEDRSVRERQIRMWRKLKLYWNNFQRVWWNEVAHDWRNWDPVQLLDQDQSSYYDKPVNIFRASLESIFAALSVTIPPINCTPDDADNPLDLSTAKAGDKSYELISKQIDAAFQWLHMLFIYGTEGLICVNNFTEEDEKYGTYEVPEHEIVERETESPVCPECKGPITNYTANIDEYDPDPDAIYNEPNLCPNCMMSVMPEMQKSVLKVERIIGNKKKAKSRQKVESYGGLYVKVPNYASKQEEMPYLFFSKEFHYSYIVSRKYPDLDPSKINGKGKPTPGGGGMWEPYERWGRLNPQYYGEYPINVVTERRCWLRPCAFNVLPEVDAKELQKRYPNGAYVILVNDQFAYSCEQSLDDHWTCSKNPLSDYMHHDPLGMLLVSLQDITNDLISLTLQTIEHGIPQTFVDPGILNLNAYKQMEAAPGSLIPTKPGAGKKISDGFYEVKTAILSSEVLPFGDKVQQLAQFTSGAMPSIFGGPQEGGSNTAAEYNTSRAQALQRLNTTWKMLASLWEGVWGKVIPSYFKNLVEDERYVTRDESGNFINVFIRKAETEGKIGSITCEASENLPSTWLQKKDTYLSLLSAGNEQILSILGSPENLPVLREALGLNEIYIPGEDDRQKQYEEINVLVNSAPIDAITPSVMVDPLLDNHQVEAEICRKWLISEVGRLTKIENEFGYLNVLLHFKQHTMIIQQQLEAEMQQEQQTADEPGSSGTKPGAKMTGAQKNGPGKAGSQS